MTCIKGGSDVIDTVSEENLRETVKHLTSYPTRWATSPYFLEASEWACNKLDEWGYCTSLQSVPLPSQYSGCDYSISYNVVAAKDPFSIWQARKSYVLQSVLVIAHLDSYAPGADDNASGCAALLEIARIVAATKPACSIRFVLTTAEEIEGQGGRWYLNSLPLQDRSAIKAVVNIDQVGRRYTDEPTVTLETDNQCEWLADVLDDAAQKHTGLCVERSLDPWGGDHIAFLRADIPAVLTIEGNDKQIHSEEDREEFIDYGLVAEITKMNLAAILELTKGEPK